MMLEAPEGFAWAQYEAMELVCLDCEQVVKAEVVDLHFCGDDAEVVR